MSDQMKYINVPQMQKDLTLADKDFTDWHAKNTVIFGDLIQDGYDWGQDEWTSYTMSKETLEAIRPRINKKIERRYFLREVGALPVIAFRMNILNELDNIMAELGPVYEILAEGIDFQTLRFESRKEMDVDSEFPQAMLDKTGKDYASNSTIHQTDSYSNLGQLDILTRISAFEEPDKKVLDAIRFCFSNNMSFNY